MTLNSFEISDVGPITHARCEDIPQVMVIAGANGVGKSTLLEEIFTFDEDSFDGDTDRAYFGPHRSPQGQTITEVNLAAMRSMSSREVFSHTSNRQGSRHRGINELLEEQHSAGIPGRINRNNSRTEPDFLPYYEVKRRVAQLQHEMSELLFEEYDPENGVPGGYVPELGQPFTEAVDTVLPGIDFEGIEKEGNEYALKFTNRGGTEVEFDELSSGEKDLIALVFLAVEHKIQRQLAERDLSDPPEGDLLVLIDGPESYLHPRLQLNFIEFVHEFTESYSQEDTVQFVICTHSKSILDKVTKKELFFLVYPNRANGNQLKSAEGISTGLLDEVTHQLGTILLSSGKNLLLVEGPTDRDILRIFYPQLEAGVDVIPMSGKDPILSTALNKLIPELSDTGVKVSGIVDRDRDLSLDSSVSHRIHKLPVTCLENFLLEEEPLFNVLADPLVGVSTLEDDGITGPDDIETMIQDIATSEDFINKEVETRWNENVNPINIKIQGFRDSQYSDIEDYAEDCVQTRLQRTDSISDIEQEVRQLATDGEYDKLDGKELLQQISNKFSLDKDRLAREIASQMKFTELDLPDTTSEFIEEIQRS